MTTFTLNHVTLYCQSLSNSIEFYNETLKIPLLSGGPECHYAMFGSGACRLVVMEQQDKKREKKQRYSRILGKGRENLEERSEGAALSLTCSDLEAVYNQLLLQGIHFEDQPTRQNWGGLQVRLRDPDGHMLYLTSPAL